MDRLSAVDAGFLRVDRPEQPMQVAFGLVLEGPAPTRDELVAALTERVPSELRRVPCPHPWRRPTWLPVDLDIAAHLDDVAPDPVTGAAPDLDTVVTHALGTPLPAGRPLWSAHLALPGPGARPEDQRWVLVLRAHHATVDGLGGVDALLQICDDGDAVAPTPTIGRRSQHGLSGRDRFRAMGDLGTVLLHPDRTLSGPLSGQRTFAVARGELGVAKAAGRALGATVNDVALAVVAGGLRDLLHHRGQDPAAHPLRSLVPLSVRTSDERGSSGNLITGVLPALPVDEPDLHRRIRRVAETMTTQKARGNPAGAAAVIAGMERLPEPLAAGVAHLLSRWPRSWVGTATSNIPGPAEPLHLLGREVAELVPCLPLGQRMRLTIAIGSHTGALHCGLTADAVHVPDVGVVADGIEAGWAQLRAST